MFYSEDRQYDDLDIRISIGRLLINVYYVRLIAPCPGWAVRNHSHSSYELHFIPFGKGTLSANRKNFQITPNTFYLTGPGVFHQQKTDAADPMVEYCINFDYKVRQAGRSRDSILETEMDELIRILQNNSFWFGQDEFSTMELFDRVFTELEQSRVGYYTSVRNYVSQIIINSIRSCAGDSTRYSFPHKAPVDHRRQIVDDLFHYQYDTVTMEQMAERINVSTRQLDRIVRQYYAASFKEKLIGIRMENAIQLLKGTTLQVQEVARKTGFSCPDYFRKVFKEKTGMAPQDYRKKNSGQSD